MRRRWLRSRLIELNDTQATSPNSFFLSSIWMSGYGPAADDSGNILFVTGNSDYSGTTYDGVTNIQESVMKVSSNLTTVLDLFTPSDQGSLDQTDEDFGSGGVLVLPDQPGSLPHLAVAAGKDGNMYFMNEDNLGGYSTTKNNVFGTYSIGGCWCGESYFVDPSDGVGARGEQRRQHAVRVEAANLAQPKVDQRWSCVALWRRAGSWLLHHRVIQWQCQPHHLGAVAAGIAAG